MLYENDDGREGKAGLWKEGAWPGLEKPPLPLGLRAREGHPHLTAPPKDQLGLCAEDLLRQKCFRNDLKVKTAETPDTHPLLSGPQVPSHVPAPESPMACERPESP